jgi:hypothetical protein
MRRLQAGGFELVILDVGLPDGSGLAALPDIRETPSCPEVIILTGEGDAEGAERATMVQSRKERRKVNMLRNWRTLFGTGLAILVLTGYSNADPVYYWSFDDTKELEIPWGGGEGGETIIPGSTREEVSGVDYDIHGLAKYTTGVSGSAMKFDGFSSYVNGGTFTGPWVDGWGEMPEELTIEAWIALGAYPWNWAPIVTVGKFRVTGFFFGVDSSGRLGFHVSDDTAVWHECNSSLDPKTHAGLELKKWYHVAATFDTKKGTAIYINGTLAGTYDEFRGDTKIVYSNMDEGFYLGKNPVDLAPTDPVRTWATYPSRYSFDGIIDEVKIHGGAMSASRSRWRMRLPCRRANSRRSSPRAVSAPTTPASNSMTNGTRCGRSEIIWMLSCSSTSIRRRSCSGVARGIPPAVFPLSSIRERQVDG